MDEKIELLRKLKGKRYVGTIDNWTTIVNYLGETLVQGMLVVKDIKDDKRGLMELMLVENQKITTTNIVKIYEEESVLETENSFYTLGTKLTGKIDENK